MKKICFLILLLLPVYGVAEEGESPTIGSHQKRSGGVPFPENDQSGLNFLKEFFSHIPKEHKKKAGQLVLSFAKNLPSKLGTMSSLRKLPTCGTSFDKRVQVHTFTQGSNAIDYTFYNPDNRTQLQKAKELGYRAIPYREGDTFGINNKSHTSQAMFGLMMGVRCLPTRIHFVMDGPNRFFEYREGDNAWLEEGQKNKVEYYSIPVETKKAEESKSITPEKKSTSSQVESERF